MMRVATKAPAFAPAAKDATFFSGAGKGSPAKPEDVEWEVRPGGMLVQKRGPDADAAAAGPPAPTIRVRVKYGAALHEVCISSQATFGELKRLVAERTGLHPQDQKVLFKGKERESAAFLDTASVKDRSKVVLVEDPAAQARRVLEMRRAANAEKAAKAVSQISLEINRLAAEVSQLEAIVDKGKKVAEGDVLAPMEQLMDQLLKLNAVTADGDVKLQRRMQMRRVQKYVETLDVIKLKNSMPCNGTQMNPPQQQQNRPYHHQHHQQHKKQEVLLQRVHQQPAVMVTTKWETFDLLSGPPPPSAPSTFVAAAPAAAVPITRFEWELF